MGRDRDERQRGGEKAAKHIERETREEVQGMTKTER